MSLIDDTKPVFGNPTTESVRDNFAITKHEIGILENAALGAPFLPLAGGTMTGALVVQNTVYSRGALAAYYFADRASGIDWALHAEAGDVRFHYAGIAEDVVILSRWGLSYPAVTGPAGLPAQFKHAFGWTGSRVRLFVDNENVGDVATAAELGAFLPLAGGTVTGALIVQNTVYSRGALAGYYFEDRGSGIDWVLYGEAGEIRFHDSGAADNVVNLGRAGFSYPAVTGAQFKHAFGWTGSRVRLFVDNANVGDVATDVDLAAFLPLAGGTMTGTLAFDLGVAAPAPDDYTGVYIQLFPGMPGSTTPIGLGLEPGGMFFSGRNEGDHFSWHLGERVARLETAAEGGGGNGDHGDAAMFLQIIDSVGRRRLARVRVQYDAGIPGGDETGGWLVVEGVGA